MLRFEQWANFCVYDAENRDFVGKPQLDLRVRKLGADGDDPVLADGLNPAAADSSGVLDEKAMIRNPAARGKARFGAETWIHAYDAAGKQVGKSEVVLAAQFGIKESVTVDVGQERDALR